MASLHSQRLLHFYAASDQAPKRIFALSLCVLSNIVWPPELRAAKLRQDVLFPNYLNVEEPGPVIEKRVQPDNGL